jgi:hypothetical protein
VEIILAIPILIVAFILQTTIVARITLLNGFADLTMLILIAWSLQERSQNAWMWAIIGGLVIGFGSAFPWFIFPICYLAIVWMAHFFRSRIWQSPILAMMLLTVAGTFILLGIEYFILRISGINLVFNEILTRTILPGMLLNLLFAFPVYFGMRELSRAIFSNIET